MAHFVVPGNPVAQPRHRVSLAGGFPRTYLAKVKDKTTGRNIPHPVIDYKKRIAMAAMQVGGMVVGPVTVEMRFYIQPPKKYKKWATDQKQRDEAIQSKPDVDNLAKAVLDALTGVLYHDDSQVVHLMIRKENSTAPRTEVWVERHK